MRIDTHCHWAPPEYLTALTVAAAEGDAAAERLHGRHSSGPIGSATVEVVHLQDMDEGGIDIAVLSIPPPGVVIADRAAAAAAARSINDRLLASAEAHPDRFRVLLTVPQLHPDLAMEELQRCADHDLARGVGMFGVTRRENMEDGGREPLLAFAAERGLVAQLHPSFEVPHSGYSDFNLRGSLDPVYENSLAALRLVFTGVLDRIPDLDLLITHLGGTIPFLAQRIEDLSGPHVDVEHELEYYLRNRIYYDNCSYHAPGLRCVGETCGYDRIVLGSDYPLRGAIGRCVTTLDDVDLSDEVREMIYGGTASKWFS
jgi:predicted TIM-barrel fold metal-dependent hydrolase